MQLEMRSPPMVYPTWAFTKKTSQPVLDLDTVVAIEAFRPQLSTLTGDSGYWACYSYDIRECRFLNV
jgi:hypothetical protein